jgi:inosine/xanthosine triphosphatase
MKNNSKIKVVIASTNPVKINAVKNIFDKAFSEITYINQESKSGVSDQPLSNEETKKGAYNRAKAVISNADCDFGIGIEGGVMKTKQGMMTTAWCCIINKQNEVNFGGGLHFLLPKKIATRIEKGEELGLIMDEILGEKNWKQKGGAIEVFSKGILNRTQAYEQLVTFALTKFISSEYYC